MDRYGWVLHENRYHPNCLQKSTYEVRKVGHVEFVEQRGDDIRRTPSFLNIKVSSSLRSRPKLVLTWAAPKYDITLYDSQRAVDVCGLRDRRTKAVWGTEQLNKHGMVAVHRKDISSLIQGKRAAWNTY